MSSSFSHALPTTYSMEGFSFRDYVLMREGLVPPFRIAVPSTKINPFPVTQARLKRNATKPVRAPDPFQPTLHKVAEIVPEKFVAKVRPM